MENQKYRAGWGQPTSKHRVDKLLSVTISIAKWSHFYEKINVKRFTSSNQNTGQKRNAGCSIFMFLLCRSQNIRFSSIVPDFLGNLALILCCDLNLSKQHGNDTSLVVVFKSAVQ